MILAAPFLCALALAQIPDKPAVDPKVETKDVLVGTGAAAKTGDVVEVDYTGDLENGTQFDTSIGKKPLKFVLGIGEVIKGWDMGVIGMKKGGKRELTIPPTLAYGANGAGPIPPNSTLKFSVTLVTIDPPSTVTTVVKGTGAGAKLNDAVFAFVKVSIQGGKTISDTRDDTKDPVPLQVGERGMPIGLLTGLLGIEAGETRKVVVPPELAFGDKGIPPADQGTTKAGSIIAPNSTLIFEVQCVKIQPWNSAPPDKRSGL